MHLLSSANNVFIFVFSFDAIFFKHFFCSKQLTIQETGIFIQFYLLNKFYITWHRCQVVSVLQICNQYIVHRWIARWYVSRLKWAIERKELKREREKKWEQMCRVSVALGPSCNHLIFIHKIYLRTQSAQNKQKPNRFIFLFVFVLFVGEKRWLARATVNNIVSLYSKRFYA